VTRAQGSKQQQLAAAPAGQALINGAQHSARRVDGSRGLFDLEDQRPILTQPGSSFALRIRSWSFWLNRRLHHDGELMLCSLRGSKRGSGADQQQQQQQQQQRGEHTAALGRRASLGTKAARNEAAASTRVWSACFNTPHGRRARA
jgi:hypothetical protein